MRREEARIVTPCSADWSAMTPLEARRRLCAECDKVVHDLSAMTEADARRALRSGPICVRYLYDVHGNLVRGDVSDATIVPAGALTGKRRLGGAIAIVATAVAAAMVFEACGGTAGGFDQLVDVDAMPDAKPPHVYPDAALDAGPDGGTDAGVDDASGADAAP